MKIVNPSYTILRPCALDAVARKDALHAIADAARTCYKSTGTDDATLVAQLVRSGHEAMLEHYSISVRFVVDRGVSHEIVRHRMASYAQESTRYCNYSKGKFDGQISVICPEELKRPKEFDSAQIGRNFVWTAACEEAETRYLQLVDQYGVPPELARSVLPHALATEIVMSANLREWRHFLALRAVGTTGKPHPQIRQVALPLLHELADWLPEVFADLDKRTRDDVPPECVHVVVPRPKPAAEIEISLPDNDAAENIRDANRSAKKGFCRGMR